MGGKRKKSNNGPIKKESKYKIPTRFDCPLCDTKASIVVKIFRATSDAVVRCRVCGAGKDTRWNVLKLEKPVDVFFRFHEALIRRDHADLQRVEMIREGQRGGATTTTPSRRTQGDETDHQVSSMLDTAAVAGHTRGGTGAAATAGAASGTLPAQRVASLGELQRKLEIAMAPAGSSAIQIMDDFEGEAEGAAAHYFSPREEVHHTIDEDDEYDELFR